MTRHPSFIDTVAGRSAAAFALGFTYITHATTVHGAFTAHFVLATLTLHAYYSLTRFFFFFTLFEAHFTSNPAHYQTTLQYTIPAPVS